LDDGCIERIVAPRQPRPQGRLEHDPEKWGPVFGKDHAQSKS
jgi:hypothetical protein